jgi:hypothetical protein
MTQVTHVYIFRITNPQGDQMKGLIITSAAVALSVAALMSQSADEPSKSSAIFAVDHSWACDYTFDRSTNLWM